MWSKTSRADWDRGIDPSLDGLAEPNASYWHRVGADAVRLIDEIRSDLIHWGVVSDADELPMTDSARRRLASATWCHPDCGPHRAVC